MNIPSLEQYSLLLMNIDNTHAKKNATYAENDAMHNPTPESRVFGRLLRRLAALASKVTDAIHACNITLGRRTTIVPGLSDRTIARLSTGEHLEDKVRWNALAHQYGGMRSRI
jgi:hypothetical protein